ncbi:conserved hypothetical protein [Ricinus communis]|uniref:Uncharacterized protein n=1 Tax=Ricinus communis TaxID=3988 RepID=B9S2H0_RICCO|nr:conserved hypothetical protein [Ricinus communis]
MARKANKNKKKCLCEKTIELVVNIVKLSSISLASVSFRSTLRLPAAAGRLLSPVSGTHDDGAMPALCQPQKSRAAEGGLSSRSQWTTGSKRITSSSQKNSSSNDADIDVKASKFIRMIREKNMNSAFN